MKNLINMKKHLLIAISLIFSTYLQAQEVGQYLFVNAGGGLHNLSYALKNGSEKGEFGYTFNAGYGYFLNKHWGLQTGIGLQSYSSVATIHYNTSVPATDADGETYEYRTSYNNWKEKQQLLFVEIPLGMQYRCDLTQKLQLLAGTGIKISFPVKKNFRTTGGEIVTTGYYSQYNVVLSDLPRHGFNTIAGPLTGDVPLKTSYSLFADFGVLYGLPHNLDLYAGGYLNYGVNNVASSSGKLVYQQDGNYNSVLDSNQTDRARTIAIGLKMGVVWHFGGNNAVTEPTIKVK